MDRAQGGKGRVVRKDDRVDKVRNESHEEGTMRYGLRRGSQSEDIDAMVNCLDCKQILGTSAKCIECDNCSNWLCVGCSGLSNAKFEAISEEPRHDLVLPALPNRITRYEKHPKID